MDHQKYWLLLLDCFQRIVFLNERTSALLNQVIRDDQDLLRVKVHESQEKDKSAEFELAVQQGHQAFLRFMQTLNHRVLSAPRPTCKGFVVFSGKRVDYRATWRALSELHVTQIDKIILFRDYFFCSDQEIAQSLAESAYLLSEFQELKILMSHREMKICMADFQILVKMADFISQYSSVVHELEGLLRGVFGHFSRGEFDSPREIDLIFNFFESISVHCLQCGDIPTQFRIRLEAGFQSKKSLVREYVAQELQNIVLNESLVGGGTFSFVLSTLTRYLNVFEHLHGRGARGDQLSDIRNRISLALSQFESILTDVKESFSDGQYLDWEVRTQLCVLRDFLKRKDCGIPDHDQYYNLICGLIRRAENASASVCRDIDSLTSPSNRELVMKCIYEVCEGFRLSSDVDKQLLYNLYLMIFSGESDGDDQSQMLMIVNSIFVYFSSLQEKQQWDDFVAYRSDGIKSWILDPVDMDGIQYLIVPFIQEMNQYVEYSFDYSRKVTYKDLANIIHRLQEQDNDQYIAFCDGVLEIAAAAGFWTRSERDFEISIDAVSKLLTVALLWMPMDEVKCYQLIRRKLSYACHAYDVNHVIRKLSFEDVPYDSDCVEQFIEANRTRYSLLREIDV